VSSTVDEIYYEIVETVLNAAQTFIEETPTDKYQQVDKMCRLFVGVMAAFMDTMPSLQEEHALALAKSAYQTMENLRLANKDKTKPQTGLAN